MTSNKLLYALGRIASVISIIMYVSYVLQIIDNINGQKSNPVQPLVAALNCVLWVSYGFLKPVKDWPVVIANLPGIFLGLMTAITAIW